MGVNDLQLVVAVNIDAAIARTFFGQQEFDVDICVAKMSSRTEMVRTALSLRGNERTILNRPVDHLPVFVHELDGLVAIKKHDGPLGRLDRQLRLVGREVARFSGND